jgi:hypothetical protein
MKLRVRIPDYVNPGMQQRVGEVLYVTTLWHERPALLKGTTYKAREDVATVRLDGSDQIVNVDLDDCDLIAY